MRHLLLTLSAALFSTAVALTDCLPAMAFGPGVTSTATMGVDVSKAAKLFTVDSPAGGVSYVGDLEDKIEVVAVKRAQTDEALAAIQVRLEAKDDVVALSWTQPDRTNSNRSVSFTIHGPKRLGTRMKLGAGGIKVTGVDGDLMLDTGAGSIEITGGAGSKVVLHTGAGEIKATGLDTNLRAETKAGEIHVIGRLRGDNLVKTGAGEVTVALPASSRIKVEASTGAGRLSNDFGLKTKGRVATSASGTIGDGGDGSLTIHSGAGGVSLKKRD